MDGENNGKPYEQMDDLGGKNHPYFWKHPSNIFSINLWAARSTQSPAAVAGEIKIAEKTWPRKVELPPFPCSFWEESYINGCFLGYFMPPTLPPFRGTRNNH